MMKYGLLVVAVVFLSCSEDDTKVLTSTDLTGKWIESGTRLDTLSFESWENFEIMNLYRGKEVLNGYLLPKSGSGPYNYTLAEEKIALNSMLSSDSKYNSYYFKIHGNTLSIGNFYDSTLGETLTFEKLD